MKNCGECRVIVGHSTVTIINFEIAKVFNLSFSGLICS